MIIKLVGRDNMEVHFNVQNRLCGYAAQLVTWNHQIYTLVTPALDPLPTYRPLPPIPKIESRWLCQPPERTKP